MTQTHLTRVVCTLIIALIFSCSKPGNTNLEEAAHFAENISAIKDTITKCKLYKIELVVCSIKKMDNYNTITLVIPDTTYFVQSNFDLKVINGVSVLFVDHTDKNITKEKKEKLHLLLKKKIIAFGQSNWITHPPYWKFVFCCDDYNKIKCFDNIIEDQGERESLNLNITYNEMMFYPKCD
jgi:hypothetical protein